jgi:hypothetical protein
MKIMKIGFHKSFSHATSIPSSPYVLENGDIFCVYFLCTLLHSKEVRLSVLKLTLLKFYNNIPDF